MNERKGKVKRGKDEEVNGQGGRRVARPHTGQSPDIDGSNVATASQGVHQSLTRIFHRSLLRQRKGEQDCLLI